MDQTFYDDQVTYLRSYFVEHKLDDEPALCKATDDLAQCRYGVQMKVVLDPCGSTSPLVVLFPTGLNPRCRVEYKGSRNRSAPGANRALPWEAAGAPAFLHSWSSEKELDQRRRCGTKTGS